MNEALPSPLDPTIPLLDASETVARRLLSRIEAESTRLDLSCADLCALAESYEVVSRAISQLSTDVAAFYGADDDEGDEELELSVAVASGSGAPS